MNKLKFNDENVKKLGFFSVDTQFSDTEVLNINNNRARLMLRAKGNTKSFFIKLGGTKVNLGLFDEVYYTVQQAKFDAMKYLEKGELETTVVSPSLRKVIQEVEVYDRDVLQRKGYTQDSYRMKLVPKHILDLPIHMVRWTQVKELREHILKTSTPKQFNMTVAKLRAIWNKARKHFYRDLLWDMQNPFSDLKIENLPKKKRAIPSFDELVDMWRTLNSYEMELKYKVIFKLKMAFGCHLTELLKFKREHIVKDEFGTWLHMPVNHHKNSTHDNGIEHRLWLHPKLADIFWSYMAEYKPNEFIFGGFEIDKPLHKESVSRWWWRMKRDTGIKYTHDTFRHALITYCRNKCNSSLITGHCYVESTQARFYTNWEDEAVRGEFKQANFVYQTALIEALGNEF